MSTELQQTQSPGKIDIYAPPANPKEGLATLRGLLKQEQSRLSAILPKQLTFERLSNVAIDAAIRLPDLLKCTPISVFNGIRMAAALGFEPGGPLGDCYLIPFRNTQKGGIYEAQFIPGYRGLISLARRSGQVLSIEADVVHEHDTWTYKKTQHGPDFLHIPTDEADAGKMLRVYATAVLRDTPLPVVVVMSKAQIDAIRARSKASGKGPWVTDYEEMAKKTVIKRMSKLLPMSIEFANAIDREDRIERGLPPDIRDEDVIDVLTAPPESEREAIEAPAEQGALPPATAAPKAAPAPRASAPATTQAEAAAFNLDPPAKASGLDKLVKPPKAKAAEPAAAPAPAKEPDTRAERCMECGALPGRDHHVNCPEHPSRHTAPPPSDGDEIQGRDE